MDISTTKCIICEDSCGDHASGERSMPWDDSPPSSLRCQLSVMLLVRKVLNIPPKVIEPILRTKGDPATWGLRMCGPCRRIFVEAEFVNSRIVQLNQEFNDLADMLRRQLKMEWNKNATTEDEIVETNPLPIPRGRGKRKRRRKGGGSRASPVRKEPSESVPINDIRHQLFGTLQPAEKVTATRIPPRTLISIKKRTDTIGFVDFAKVGKIERSEIHSHSEHEQDHDHHDSFAEDGEPDPGMPILVREGESSHHSDDFTTEHDTLHDIDHDNDNNSDQGGGHDDGDGGGGDSDYVPHEEIEDNDNGNDAVDDDPEYTVRARSKSRPAKRRRRNRGGPPRMRGRQIAKKKRIDVFSIPQPLKIDSVYFCPLCPRKCFLKSSMHGHILRAHYADSTPFHCHLCPGQFNRESILRSHLVRYHGEEKTPLDDPDQVNAEDNSEVAVAEAEIMPKRDVAQDSIVYNEKLECDLCPADMKYRPRYKNAETLEAHKKIVHLGISKPYECKICGKSFKWRDVLRTHLFSHRRKIRENKDPIRPYCLECNREFKDSETLKYHLKIKGHTTTFPFQCEICREGFLQASQLDDHMWKGDHSNLSSTDDGQAASNSSSVPTSATTTIIVTSADGNEGDGKPVSVIEVRNRKRRGPMPKPKTKERYYCAECNKEFKNANCMRIHFQQTKSHASQSPYQCELCAKGFMQRNSLENHQTQEHWKELNIQPYKCKFCEKILSSKRSLDHHIRLKHTKKTKFRCDECDLGFMFEQTYKRHLAVVHENERPLLCSQCPKSFALQTHLDTHMRVHTGEKPYKCKFCEKEYSDRPTFNRHVETHGDQIHKCSYCPKEFKVWHTFRIHMRAAHKQVIYKNPVIRAPGVEDSTEEKNSTVTNISPSAKSDAKESAPTSSNAKNVIVDMDPLNEELPEDLLHDSKHELPTEEFL